MYPPFKLEESFYNLDEPYFNVDTPISKNIEDHHNDNGVILENILKDDMVEQYNCSSAYISEG